MSLKQHWGRRLMAVTAVALACAVAPSAASAEAAYFLKSYSAGIHVGTVAQSYGTPGELPGPLRMRVIRNGAVLADATGSYRPLQGAYGLEWSEVAVATELIPGDLVEIYNPGTGAGPARSFVFDGRPTVSCTIGSDQLSGVLNPNTYFTRVGAYADARDSLRPDAFNGGLATIEGGTWKATLQRPLRPEDTVTVTSVQRVDYPFTFQRTTRVPASACAAAPPAGGSGAKSDGKLAKLRKRDFKQKSNRLVTVRVRCLAASTIPCRARAALTTVRRFAKPSRRKKTRLALASGRAKVAPGRSKTIRLKLKRSSVKLLKRKHKLKARANVVTRGAKNKRLTRSRTVTLRYKR